MPDTWVWFPASGTGGIEFTPANGYLITRIAGANQSPSRAQTHKAPFQSGETAVGVAVDTRTIELDVLVVADTEAQIRPRLRTLQRIFAASPRAHHDDPLALGTLRLLPGDGGPELEIQAIPQNSPDVVHDPQDGPLLRRAILEFLCPHPWFREVASQSVELQRSGGFAFPVSFPFAMPSNDALAEITNSGDVAVGILARIFGPAENPTLTNVTHDETLGVSFSVPDGSYLEIETGFGRKTIDLVDSTGARTNVFYALNLQQSSFWTLRPGLNVIEFRRTGGDAGRAAVFWQPEYAGI